MNLQFDKKHTRLIIGCVFLCLDIFSHLISAYLKENYSEDYWIYYFIVCFLDIYLILFLATFDNISLIADLMIINGVAVIAHFYGLIIWWLYVAPESYDYAVYLLAAIQWIRLLWIDKNDKAPVGFTGIYKYVHRVRAFNFV